ncbi:SDR family NAD(P)-dependent oxidoreductase [Paenibacillus tarimensis]|uniref:SDR family NAD(P)-dependent oxidoreductase n=1 Tax=Paenibacillus tarimensis TaxID=416012 RepID=UPI001F213F89|nr:SDR family NAD(P)-dependent oxidoreductase [Paenibacillus tarimensis]MCF2943978.1 SDR family NAD(P)-dependent oxidoreductase [Paenibacillus tarimensis]
MKIEDVLKRLQAGELNPEYAALLLQDLDDAAVPAASSPAANDERAEVDFHYNDAYVRDHVVHGDRILLGVTYAGLALKALEGRLPWRGALQLKNVIFKSPIVLNPEGAARIYTEIDEASKEVSIHSVVNGVRQEIAAAGFTVSEEAGRQLLPVGELKQRAADVLTADSIYSWDDQLGIWHGPSLKTLDRLYMITERECLGELTVKPGDMNDQQDADVMASWPVHPALIEAAVLSGIHLLSPSERKPYIPISVKSVQMYGPLSLRAYSHVRLVKVKNDLLELQMDLYNSEGELAVRIDGFAGKHFAAAKAQTSQPDRLQQDPQALEKTIKGYIVGMLNKVSGREDITEHSKKNFMEIGLDSVQLLQLAKQIEDEIKIELYPTLFFEYSNINELSGYFIEQFPSAFAAYFGTAVNSGTEQKPAAGKNAATTDSLDAEIIKRKQAERSGVSGNHDEDDGNDDIAIIGMSGMLPESADLEQFWQHLMNKSDLIKEIPESHFDYKPWYDERPQRPDKLYCRHGSFIDPVAKFDAEFFGVSPTEAEIMDPQLRKLLEVTHAAFEDAGYAESIRGSNTGYYVGACFHDYCFEMLKSGKRVGPYDGTGNAATMLANYPSFYFDLKGPSLTVDTACSSSLVALHLACNALKNGECEMSVVSGVNLLLSSWHYLYFCSTGVLSKSGRCHTFDGRGDGYVPGEAIISLLLKPLKKAQRDGDNIHAVIKASAINHGGHTPAITAPSVRREADVISEAWGKAGVDPERISYIEAHGTGTKLGDPVEINGIKLAFDQLNRGASECYIGSVKASIGHTEGAAGLAGVVRVILAMKNKVIPAMPKFETLNPLIRLEDSPLVINREPVAWEKRHDLPRMAGVSSFGFGGSYSHVVLEEYEEPQQARLQTTGPQLLVLSARTETALKTMAERLCAYLIRQENEAETSFGNICYTMNKGRRAFEERLAIVAEDLSDLIAKLSGYAAGAEAANGMWRNKASEELENQPLPAGQDLETLAKSWAAGHPVDWKHYYRGGAYRIVSLPTYPFEGKEYWISFSEIQKQQGAAVKVEQHPHPFITGEPRMNGDTAEFTAMLEGTEFYLAEHKVHGRKVLVGAALIEAAVKALNHLLPDRRCRLKNIQWFSPVIVNDAPVQIRIVVHHTSGVIQVQTSSAAGTVLHFKTEFTVHEGQQQAQLPKQAAPHKAAYTARIGKQELYAGFKQLGLDLGESFQVVSEIRTSGEQAVSFIRAEGGPQRHGYRLHPALLDGSFHILSAFYRDEKECIHVPFSIGELEVFDRLEGAMIVYAKPAEGSASDKEKGFARFDLTVTAESGEILMIIRNFVARKIKPEKVSEQEAVYYLTASWEPSTVQPGVGQSGALGGVVVLADEPAFARELCARLNLDRSTQIFIVTRGERFRPVAPGRYELNPVNHEDYAALWKHIGDGLSSVRTIIHLWSQEPFGDDPACVQRQLDSGPLSYFHLCQSLAHSRLSHTIDFIYLYACGQEMVEPVYEALPGMSKSIGHEFSKLRTQVIGYTRGTGIEGLTRIIMAEAGMNEHEVMYKGGQRYSRVFRRLPDAPPQQTAEIPLREQGVVVITGGLGTIGLAIGRYLAKTHRARLVLAGRRTAPDFHSYRSHIQQLGGDCVYVSGDVNRGEDVEQIIAAAKSRYGTVNGIIHCAGIVKDSSVFFKTKADLDAVTAPKVYGTLLLDRATKGEELDVFVTLSSISALIGNAGQSDYAFANGFMDRFCAWRNRQLQQGLRRGKALSINYPLWKDGGMRVDPAIEQALVEKFGMRPISQETGIETLIQGLRSPVDQVCVVEGMRRKIDTYMKHVYWDERAVLPAAGAVVKGGGSGSGSEKQLAEELARIASKLVNRVDLTIMPETTLEQCGMDSIAYMEFTNQINENFNLDVSPAILFSNPSMLKLAQQLLEDYPDALKDRYQSETDSVMSVPSVTSASPGAAPSSYELPPEQSGYGQPYDAYPAPAYAWQASSQQEALGYEASYQNSTWQEAPSHPASHQRDIAIIGMDGVFPDSPDLLAFWENIAGGKDLIGEIPAERWDWKALFDSLGGTDSPTALKWGGFIQDVDAFDHQFFHITPREAEQMDPQQRLFMMMAWKAIEDSGYSPAEFSGKKVGVFAGASSFDYMDLLRQSGSKVEAYTSIGNAHSIIANRLSYFLNLRGPSETIDTACSSSLVAIARAIESLRNGECELAIAGGINLMLSPVLHQSFSEAGMLSVDGRCKTFDRSANGYVRGEGGGVIVLKLLDQALEAKDPIHAVIKGVAINHGGRATNLTAPNPEAQAELLIDCYEKANVNPSTLQYIEAHGTGTPLGDAIEIEGLKQAFRALTPKSGNVGSDQPKCAIGSVKTNIGHLEAAAGIAGLIKTVLAMKNRKIPPHLHLNELNPELRLGNSPFYIPAQLEEWKSLQSGDGRTLPRRAGISSFGFGGTNAHIVVEEFQEPARPYGAAEERKNRIFTFSARSEYSLREYAGKLLHYLEHAGQSASLEEIAYNLQVSRSSMEVRAAVIASDRTELVERLQRFLAGEASAEGGIYAGDRSGGEERSRWLSLFDNTSEDIINLFYQAGEIRKIALLWSMGVQIRWEGMYPGGKPRRISLPTYVFSRDRHWAAGARVRIPSPAVSQSGSHSPAQPIEPQKQPAAVEAVKAEEAGEGFSGVKQIEHDLKQWILDITKIDPAVLDEETELAEIGMDSILSMELVSKINQTYGIRIYANELLMNPSISRIALLLQEELGGAERLQERLLAAAAPKREAEEIKAEAKPGPKAKSEAKPAVPSAERKPAMLSTVRTGGAPSSFNTTEKRIVYVLSSPRSGSTLLRTMLMGHSEIFSPPEIMLLPYDTMKEWDRSLKRRKWVHFKDGLIESIKVLKNLTPDEAVKEVQNMINAEYPIRDVYELLQQLTPSRYVVDKTPPYAEKLDILQRAEQITPNALYIYLHRHPLSVTESLVRNRFHKMLGSKKDPWSFADEAWRISNQNIIDFLDTVPGERTKRIVYEEMVADPEGVMKDVSNWLGVDYEDAMIKPYEGDRMLTGLREGSMSVGDPNFLNHTGIEAELADSWKKHLEFKDKLSRETIQLAEGLGYFADYGLAPAQEAYLRLADPAQPFVMVQSVSRELPEKPDAQQWNLLLAEVLDAHPVLTNKFLQEGGHWRQQPSAGITPKVRIVNAESLNEEQRHSYRKAQIEEAVPSIDPAAGKLLELIIMENGDLRCEFIMLVHHLVCDAVSASVIWKELFDRYEGRLDGEQPAEHGYRDYIGKLESYAQSQAHQDARPYWTEMIAAGASSIPVDHPDSPEGNTASSEAELERFLTYDQISAASLQESWFPIIAAALYDTVMDWTKETTVCIAHRLKQRNLPVPGSFDHTVGWFAADVPIAVTQSEGWNELELLQDFKGRFGKSSPLATSYQLLANQGELPDVHELCAVRLNFQQAQLNTLGLEDWTAGMYAAPEADRLYLLDCIVRERASGLQLIVRYSNNRHHQHTVEQFLNRWQSRIRTVAGCLNQSSVGV